MDCARRRYQPRHVEAGVLHGVIREHLDEFLRAAADRADSAGLPEFIAREFREFLTCGVLAHGFARVRCERCAFGLSEDITVLYQSDNACGQVYRMYGYSILGTDHAASFRVLLTWLI